MPAEEPGIVPRTVPGVINGAVPGVTNGAVPRVTNGAVPGVINGAVPNLAVVEKFPFGIPYVMLSEGNDTGSDGIDTGADGVDGGLCGPPEGGPQSKPTLWMPTSHSDRSTCFGS